MAESIKMSTEKLEVIKTQLCQLQSELNQQSSMVRALAGQLDETSGADVRMRISLRLVNGGLVSGDNAQDVLNRLNRSLRACGDEAKRVRGAIASAQQLFGDNERRIAASFHKESVGSGSAFGGASGSISPVGPAVPVKAGSSQIDWRWKDLMVKLVESAGMGGGVISGMIELGSFAGLAKFVVKGADAVAEWGSIVKGYSKLKNFGTGYALKTYAKKIFGLNSYARSMGFTPSKSASALWRFSSDFSKGFKKGMSSAVAWATEAIDRGVDNYQEYTGGYKDAPTAIAEWVCETGLGVTATSAAVAAAGALIGGPAIVAAAAGGLVVWGVDTLWANTIGRGQDEDGGNEGLIEAAGEGMVELGKQAISGIGWLAEKAGAFCTDMKNIRAAWAH